MERTETRLVLAPLSAVQTEIPGGAKLIDAHRVDVAAFDNDEGLKTMREALRLGSTSYVWRVENAGGGWWRVLDEVAIER